VASFPTSRTDTTHFSFDVFDTALCRLIHAPEHIHLSVGRKLRDRGIVGFSDIEWAYARAEAEFQQRLTVPHREVTLAAIYDRLARSLDLNADDARAALETELAEEHRLIRPIAPIQERVTTLIDEKTPPLFLSDTYLSRSEVTSLLVRAGYCYPVDVVVSCEEHKSKLAGTLFGHVAAQRGIESSGFRHVGDNGLADVTNARTSGWDAQLFADSHWTGRERVLFASGRGDFLASAVAGSARAARLGQSAPVREGIVSAAATVVGPMFTAYVLWVLRDVIARGGRTIHFLARDGQVLVPICQRLAGWLGVEVKVVYMLASRQAFLLAALPDSDRKMVEQGLKLAYHGRISLSDALSSLKYSAEEIRSISSHVGVDPSARRVEVQESEIVALHDALLRPEWLDPFRTRVKTAREATLAYLESAGLFTSEEAYIVDLGWRGTTQLRLQHAVGDRVDLVGYYMGLTNTVLPPDARTRVWTTSLSIKTALLEVMASADHTSVRGFGFADDGTPVCTPPIREDPELIGWGARQQQEIALRFAEYFTEVVELEHYSIDEVHAALESAALDSYRHFRLSPNNAEAEAYGSVLHSDDINHIRHRQLAHSVTSWDVARHLVNKSSRGEVTSWYTGSLARSQGHLLPTLISTSIDRVIVLSARIRTRRRRRTARQSAYDSLGARSVKVP
jgi:FMN phosphatase YigB (HAD superfamily)